MASAPNRSSPLPPLPREHGAWFILAGSALVGPAVTLRIGLEHLALVLGAFCLLIGRSAARGSRTVDRVWALALLSVALAVNGALLVATPSRLLLGAGVAAVLLGAGMAVLEHLRLQRHFAAQLVGLAVLTSLCPASLALCGRSADLPTLGVVAANTLYFFASVPFVRARVFGPKSPAVWHALRYDALALAVSGAIVMSGAIGAWGAIAFAVQVLRAARLAAAPPAPLRSVARLGLAEVAATAYYVSALAAGTALSAGG